MAQVCGMHWGGGVRHAQKEPHLAVARGCGSGLCKNQLMYDRWLCSDSKV